mmetsp:Transcript_49331/g.157828  ORF Transcript_49331/g.157828 Transcript_49331/m.157828 type:complete len:206 (+) Transcript_49331:444-1061(+)
MSSGSPVVKVLMSLQTSRWKRKWSWGRTSEVMRLPSSTRGRAMPNSWRKALTLREPILSWMESNIALQSANSGESSCTTSCNASSMPPWQASRRESLPAFGVTETRGTMSRKQKAWPKISRSMCRSARCAFGTRPFTRTLPGRSSCAVTGSLVSLPPHGVSLVRVTVLLPSFRREHIKGLMPRPMSLILQSWLVPKAVSSPGSRK